jgi:hypothetical protein
MKFLLVWNIKYCNVPVGSISQWNFITLKVQYTTLYYRQKLYNTRQNSTSPLTQLLITTLLTQVHVLSACVSEHNFSLLLKLSLIYHTAISIVTCPFTLLCYYGNATNSLLCNSNCHVTMEMPQTHCYATVTVTLLWKCHKMHRSCYQGKPNMSQYFTLSIL